MAVKRFTNKKGKQVKKTKKIMRGGGADRTGKTGKLRSAVKATTRGLKIGALSLGAALGAAGTVTLGVPGGIAKIAGRGINQATSPPPRRNQYGIINSQPKIRKGFTSLVGKLLLKGASKSLKFSNTMLSKISKIREKMKSSNGVSTKHPSVLGLRKPGGLTTQ